ncbi:hypothetical protein PIB30_115672, partial [Stylosanthes scabra]|nr:hypothetical protein [Stylosanthes scabra]
NVDPAQNHLNSQVEPAFPQTARWFAPRGTASCSETKPADPHQLGWQNSHTSPPEPQQKWECNRISFQYASCR